MNSRLVALLGWLVLALAACGTSTNPTATPVGPSGPSPTTASSNQPSAVPTPTSVPTAVPTLVPTAVPSPTTAPAVSVSGAPRDILLRAMRAQFNAKSYRVRSTTLNLNTNTTSARLVEFAAPDRYHIMLADTEVIVIGSKSYANRKNAGWKEDPLFASAISSIRDPKAIEAILNETETSDLKLVGPELLDGRATLAYTYVSKFANFTSNVKIWIGVTDGLPYKQEVEGEVANVKSRTTNLYEYDPNIKIEAPVIK